VKSERHPGVASSFRDLRVYQLARAASGEIFAVSKSFPGEERFALTDQIRRSARATKAMITEAWARRRYKAVFINKIDEALGEANETRSWLDDALDCRYLDVEQFERMERDWYPNDRAPSAKTPFTFHLSPLRAHHPPRLSSLHSRSQGL
jgi:four helix bundle protein